MINCFVSGAITIQFDYPPLREGSGESPQVFQAEGFDSAGNHYIYEKGSIVRVTHPLAIPRVTSSLLTSLRDFVAYTVRGSRDAFTWYDHNGGSHNVRLQSSKIAHQQTGPDRHTITLTLEEDIPWSLPPTPASFDAATAAKTGVAPVWILRLTVNGIDYFLSDCAFSVDPTAIVSTPGWPAGVAVNTLPWVKSWGQIQGSITGDMSEYQISDFSCDVLVVPDAAINIDDLVTLYDIEEYPVELYLWYLGLNPATDPPRLMWRGYVEDTPSPDETTVTLDMKDESSRLQGNIGVLASTDIFPNLDPDDVGKMIPIIMNNIDRLPGIGIDTVFRTSLPYLILANDTSFLVSQSGFSAGDVIQIDNEQILIGTISEKTINTCTRGYNNTTVAQHMPTAAVWKRKTAYLYAVADHTITTMSSIIGLYGSIEVDIASYCTLYNGNHSTYPGYYIISVPASIVARPPSTYVNDGIGVDNSNLSTSDSATNCPIKNAGTTTGYQVLSVFGILPNTEAGNRAGVTITINAQFAASYTYDAAINLCNDSNARIGTLWAENGISGQRSMSFTVTLSGNYQYNRIEACIGSSNVGLSVELQSVSRTIKQIQASTSTGANVSKTGTASQAGGYQMLTGLLFSGTRTITTISIFNDILTRAGMSSNVQQTGTFPAFFALNGAINEQKTGQYWLDYLAFQCRAWYVLERGGSRLIVRPSMASSARTVMACRINNGRRVCSRKKSAIADLINRINLRYNRDWSKTRSAENYRGLSQNHVQESIRIYGEREKPDLFWFDFVTTQQMADDVRDYYLDCCHRRSWIYDIEEYLDYADLRFGDGVTLDFLGGYMGMVGNPGLSPGATQQIDVVKLVIINPYSKRYVAADYVVDDYVSP